METEQVCQILRASTAVHTYAVSDLCMCECFFRPAPGEKAITDCFERQQDFAKPSDEKKGAVKDGISKVCSDKHKNSAFCRGVTYVHHYIADVKL